MGASPDHDTASRMADHHDIPSLIADMGQRARSAARTLAQMPTAAKAEALRAAAQAIAI